MLRKITLIVILITGLNTLAQKKPNVINDLSITIHEETVNKVLSALGDIKGTSDYEVMLVKGSYTWTVKNAKINIRPDSSNFTCDAFVKVGPFDYKSEVIGNVKISYDAFHDKILIKISRAVFELYTVVFGSKLHIKDIHLEEKFKDPFVFDGPGAYGTTMEFAMPDSTTKKVFFKPRDCKMEIRWKEVCTTCEIESGAVLPITEKKANDKDSLRIKK
jgi:hypothetical protein